MLKQDVPSSARAYELFLRANEMSRESTHWQAALDLYEQCVKEDPHYAPAWAGVGRMEHMIGKYVGGDTTTHFSKAEAALTRALDLNPDLSAAEKAYAHLEVDLGRAEQSMVRLLRRARERTADPEVFAALSHALRYCGLLQASLAAARQARRLDPKVRVSDEQTWFMLGEYQKVVDYEHENIKFMRNLALVMLGRDDEALAGFESVDPKTPHLLVVYVKAIAHLIRQEFDESRALMHTLMAIKDPEARYHLARQFAYLGDREPALSALGAVIEDGFFCLPAFTRDPWLDSLRASPEFTAILRRAEMRHRQAVISFLTAEGDRILGIPHPV
jgi:tetratricopeptide (TPR) repeat protein